MKIFRQIKSNNGSLTKRAETPSGMILGLCKKGYFAERNRPLKQTERGKNEEK